jgi:hypothetical protein
MSVISAILALLKAIPILDSWFQQFFAAYAEHEIANMKAENRDSIRKALAEHDQRDLEKAIGNPNPGEASGDSGVEIVDGPPPNVGG